MTLVKRQRELQLKDTAATMGTMAAEKLRNGWMVTQSGRH